MRLHIENLVVTSADLRKATRLLKKYPKARIALDEATYDCATIMANHVCNRGPEAQIAFLRQTGYAPKRIFPVIESFLLAISRAPSGKTAAASYGTKTAKENGFSLLAIKTKNAKKRTARFVEHCASLRASKKKKKKSR